MYKIYQDLKLSTNFTIHHSWQHKKSPFVSQTDGWIETFYLAISMMMHRVSKPSARKLLRFLLSIRRKFASIWKSNIN